MKKLPKIWAGDRPRASTSKGMRPDRFRYRVIGPEAAREKLFLSSFFFVFRPRFRLTRNMKQDHNDPMKHFGLFKKNVFWIVFLLGLVWIFAGTGKPSVAHAMAPSMAMGQSLHSGKTMPVSCPMKGSLPCCHGKNRVALCKASLCDLCVLSAPGEENTFSFSRIQLQPLPAIADFIPNQPRFLLKVQLLHHSFSNKFSSFPPVSRPLLI